MPVATVKSGIYDTWVRLPEPTAKQSPRAQRLTAQILRQTGWSNRRLAWVLEISHPTVRALGEGRSRPGDVDLFARLAEVESVVSRIGVLTGEDAGETRRVLELGATRGQPSPIELLRARRPAEAYLAALESLRPPERAPLMTGFWAARAGEGTHDLSAAHPA